MGKYISLGTRSDKGAGAIKDALTRTSASRDFGKKLGCTLEQVYMTYGVYDLVAIFEAPSDEAAMAYKLGIESQGFMRFTPLRAFSEGEFKDMLGQF